MSALEPDCEEILDLLRERMTQGRKEYGDMDVTQHTDEQDDTETIEELVDAIVYQCRKIIRNKRKPEPVQRYGAPGDLVIHRAMKLVMEFNKGGPLRLLDSDLKHLGKAVKELCVTCG